MPNALYTPMATQTSHFAVPKRHICFPLYFVFVDWFFCSIWFCSILGLSYLVVCNLRVIYCFVFCPTLSRHVRKQFIIDQTKTERKIKSSDIVDLINDNFECLLTAVCQKTLFLISFPFPTEVEAIEHWKTPKLHKYTLLRSFYWLFQYFLFTFSSWII